MGMTAYLKDGPSRKTFRGNGLWVITTKAHPEHNEKRTNSEPQGA